MIFLGLISIETIHAYMGGGFSLASIPQQDLYLGIAFIVSFFIFNLAFSGFFKNSKTVSWIPALALAIGTTYGLWITGFSAEVFGSSLGISYSFLQIATIILGISFLLFLTTKIKKKLKIKFKFNSILTIIGILVLASGILNLIREKTSAITIGAILIFIGIFPLLERFFKKKKA